MVLIPLVAGQVNIPLIAAEDFVMEEALVAVLILGADPISMGTRFILTQESDIHATSTSSVSRRPSRTPYTVTSSTDCRAES